MLTQSTGNIAAMAAMGQTKEEGQLPSPFGRGVGGEGVGGLAGCDRTLIPCPPLAALGAGLFPEGRRESVGNPSSAGVSTE